WANELDIARVADLSEVSGLSQKPIAWMNRIDVKDFRGADDGRNVEITLGGRCWSNARCFVGETNVQRVTIDVTVNRDRLDAHLLTGPDDATGNLATIGDQDLLEFAWIKSHINSPQKSTKCTSFLLVLFVLFC